MMILQMTEYYKEKLEEALEYQDFVIDTFIRIGRPICIYSSKKKQYVAESSNGYEIKFDQRFRTTHRLYIETGEKKAHTSTYTNSGVLKDDNSAYFIIGDYEDMYVFSKKQLAREYKQAKWNSHDGGTQRGMYLDIYENGKINPEFNFLCLEHIQVKNGIIKIILNEK